MVRRKPRDRDVRVLPKSRNWSNCRTYRENLKLYRWVMHYYRGGDHILVPPQWKRMQIALGIVENRKERTSYPGW